MLYYLRISGKINNKSRKENVFLYVEPFVDLNE